MTAHKLTTGAVIANLNECYDIEFTSKQRAWLKKQLAFIEQAIDQDEMLTITSQFSPTVTDTMTAKDRGLMCALAVYAANYKFRNQKKQLKTYKPSVGILSTPDATLPYKIMVRKQLEAAE